MFEEEVKKKDTGDVEESFEKTLYESAEYN